MTCYVGDDGAIRVWKIELRAGEDWKVTIDSFISLTTYHNKLHHALYEYFYDI